MPLIFSTICTVPSSRLTSVELKRTLTEAPVLEAFQKPVITVPPVVFTSSTVPAAGATPSIQIFFLCFKALLSVKPANVRVALLPAASLMVPPFNSSDPVAK